MSLPYNTVWEFVIHNMSFSLLVVIVVVCAFLKMFFKIKKKEVSPFGWMFKKLGSSLTKDIEKHMIELKSDSDERTKSLKNDLKGLKDDIDAFEKKTNESIDEMKKGTNENCELLKTELNNVKKSNDIQTIRQIRTHILDFANTCRNGRKHTQEEFRSIFDENAEYETIVEKYDDIKNDYYTESLKFIKRTYQHCLDTNDFLA